MEERKVRAESTKSVFKLPKGLGTGIAMRAKATRGAERGMLCAVVLLQRLHSFVRLAPCNHAVHPGRATQGARPGKK